MTSIIGVALGPRLVRAVRVNGWVRRRIKAVELEWDPDNPVEAVAALRAQLGSAQRVALAIEPSFLFVKQVKLPPVPTEEKRRILSLEPERFFPVRGEDIVVAVREDDNLVFAAAEARLKDWIAALESLGRVDMVEPAPVALARVLGRAAGTRTTVLLDGQDGAINLVAVSDGRVPAARQVAWETAAAGGTLPDGANGPPRAHVSPWVDAAPGGDEAHVHRLRSALPGITLEPLPTIDGVAARFQSAYGAALGVGRQLNGALVSPELAHRITRRRRGDIVAAAATFVAALVLALASLDAVRGRAARELAAEVHTLQQRSSRVLAMRAEAEALSREARAVAQVEATRPDVLGALLSISRRLPRQAFVRSVRGVGADWQIDGHARDAASLVPALETAPELEGVRFLTATSRMPIGTRTYESFSIALRYVRP